METDTQSPFWVICSCRGCSSSPGSCWDGRQRRGDARQQRGRCAWRAHTPSSSPRGRRTGGALCCGTTSASGKIKNKNQGVFERAKVFGFKVCSSVISPLKVYTWLSHSGRPWSIHSSPDAHGGNTSAFWAQENKRKGKKTSIFWRKITTASQPTNKQKPETYLISAGSVWCRCRAKIQLSRSS